MGIKSVISSPGVTNGTCIIMKETMCFPTLKECPIGGAYLMVENQDQKNSSLYNAQPTHISP